MYIYGLAYNSFCRIYDLSRSTATTSLYSHQSRRKTKKSFSPNNHIFYQTARITIILISFVNFGQLTDGTVIQARAHSIGQGQANGKQAHAKIEEKVGWPLSFVDEGPVKAKEKGGSSPLIPFGPAKGDASHADNNKPFHDTDLIGMAKLLARRRETPQVKIRNTSELHVDTHNADSKEDGFLNNIPSAVYLQKVVVLQKPFHFHIPILTKKDNAHDHKTVEKRKEMKSDDDDKKRKRSKSKSLKSRVKEPDNSWIKRDIESQFQEGKALEANSKSSNPTGVDLDHLLKEHPKLIPSVSRKRDSGKLEHHDSMEDDHHLIGITLDEDDDDLEQGGSQLLVSKRNIKTVSFSQEAVDSLLGHQDDLVKYRGKIISHAKELGMKPEEAFHLLVFGVPSNQKLAKESNPHAIYERRLKFHQLFLDDSTESEKYHTEVVDKNSPSNHVNPPFNAYMKILKRSKRGLKSWLKKIFKRQPKTTEQPHTKQPEPEPVDCKKKSNRQNKDCVTSYKEDLDEKGDSQVDLLLPTPLRRSSYLKRRDELRNSVKEEEEIEEEEERSDEKEPTAREEDSEELLRYKAKVEDDDDEERRKRKRNLKRQTKPKRPKRSTGNKLNKIKMISKDEISVVLEMIFNLIEYQCTEISKKGEIMEGLLTITQTTVRSSSLPDYIPKRRSIVDKLFDQMLDCSSNTENLSKWSHYQMKRRSQKKGGDSANSGIHRSNGEVILKRKKRVRRDDTTSTAVELISINGSTTLSDNLVHGEISTTPTTEKISTNVSSNYHIVDNESINSVMKLYLIIFKIIPETCFKVDNRLINDSALVLLEEMVKLERNEEYAKEINDFVGHFDVVMADKLLTECYQNEL